MKPASARRSRAGTYGIALRRLGIIFLASAGVWAQEPVSMNVAQAVESALRNYLSIRVSQEQINAAAAGIQLARTAYLPRVDAMAQVNRATRNNVFGLLMPQVPQSVIPSISGPVIGTKQLRLGVGKRCGRPGHLGAV